MTDTRTTVRVKVWQSTLPYSGFCFVALAVRDVDDHLSGKAIACLLGAEERTERRNHRDIHAPKPSLHHHEFTASRKRETSVPEAFHVPRERGSSLWHWSSRAFMDYGREGGRYPHGVP